MARILSKDGSKLHLINQSGEPLCFGFNRASRSWNGFELSDMLLSKWTESDRRCHNCAQVFRLWAFTQFKEQIIDFISKSGISTFPIEILKDGSWRFNNVSNWPDAKIIRGDGYKRKGAE